MPVSDEAIYRLLDQLALELIDKGGGFFAGSRRNKYVDRRNSGMLPKGAAKVVDRDIGAVVGTIQDICLHGQPISDVILDAQLRNWCQAMAKLLLAQAEHQR